jgi:hypothetical protein
VNRRRHDARAAYLLQPEASVSACDAACADAQKEALSKRAFRIKMLLVSTFSPRIAAVISHSMLESQ